MSTTCNDTSGGGRNTRRLGAATERILRPFAAASAAIAGHYVRINDMIQLWLDRDRQRRALRELNDHMLQDIGISRCDVYRESTKRFWHE
jgi:uncharacterized protein YjiS (DUF1127 family)